MNFSIQKATGQKIPCIARIPENAEHIVISIHGIGANKQDTNAVNLLQRLPEAGIGVVVYDQPGHGDAASDTLSLRNCLDSLSAVEHWVRETYPAAQLGYVGSSFGAYVLGMYVGRGLNSGKKAFMRCAAVIFPEIILGDPHAELDPQAVALLDRQGYLETIVEGNVIRLPRDFLYEIRKTAWWNSTAPTSLKAPSSPLSMAVPTRSFQWRPSVGLRQSMAIRSRSSRVRGIPSTRCQGRRRRWQRWRLNFSKAN